ncbi:hypothetical protein BDW42DRAFT_183640 [Aspergillus taichungensis]|uniref:RecA family profile 1 domain-containing protein n=1 Tax=Aspergillus taichungensis TaxID=482145 RepID=A0A2J5I3G6_9EURO|nr:hypothetical protein BDW42DRAFT_183640 [Aspergillus taichungensis]
MASQTPLQSLAQNIHLYEPPSITDAPPSDPSLVILCTWLGGATPRRIHKYIEGYRGEFPGSCILLITSIVLDITLRTIHAIRARLQPARDAITRVLTTHNDRANVAAPNGDSSNSSSILLHIFSHGGSNTAVQLALSWQEEHNYPLPLGGVILDCSPGDTTFRRSYNAAVLSLPSETTPHVQSIGRALLYPTIATVTVLQHLHLMASVRDLRRQLNDPAVFGVGVPRLYLFSEADEMVGAHNVRSHAVNARRCGFAVDEVVFRSAEHCALVLEDAGRYWGAVRQFWGEVLPDFPTRLHAHIIPPLERSHISTVDLITLDPLEIAKRAHVPPADVRRLTTQVVRALHHDIGFEDEPLFEEPPSSSLNADAPLVPGPTTALDLSRWSAISTLDPALDALLGGGVPTGYLTEVTGESGSGKTQFLLSLLLSVQLPPPRGLGKSAVYISTEAPLSTSRLTQMLDSHPELSAAVPRPSLQNILSINAMDLETQDHILNYQLPVVVARHNVGLVIIDSITSNYRAEHSSSSLSGLSARSGELAKRGQMLRNLAASASLAVVVANQVSDRFEDTERPPLRIGGGAAAGSGTPFASSPSQRDPGPAGTASPLLRTRMQHSPGNLDPSSQHTALPSSPVSSSPYAGDEEGGPSHPQPPFDGSYLVGSPVRNEMLSLLHQQRFFTGWGDTRQSAFPTWSPYQRQPALKTPALGLVWATQIACRIALKKEERAATHDDGDENSPDDQEPPDKTASLESAEETPTEPPPATITDAKDRPPPSQPPDRPDRPTRRIMKLVFAPWTGGTALHGKDEPGVCDEVEFTIWEGGLRAIK